MSTNIKSGITTFHTKLASYLIANGVIVESVSGGFEQYEQVFIDGKIIAINHGLHVNKDINENVDLVICGNKKERNYFRNKGFNAVSCVYPSFLKKEPLEKKNKKAYLSKTNLCKKENIAKDWGEKNGIKVDIYENEDDFISKVKKYKYVISASTFEGSPIAIAEGLACGCQFVELIRNNASENFKEFKELEKPKDIQELWFDKYEPQLANAIKAYLEGDDE